VSAITDAELLRLWGRIETGEVRLLANVEPQAAAGNVHYRLGDGWEVVIFLDAWDFDYIDCVVAPDGRERDFNEIVDTPADWHPSPSVQWKQLGIGWWRCTVCGVRMSKRGPIASHLAPFLCGGAQCVGRQAPPEGTTLIVKPSAARIHARIGFVSRPAQ
jgi:hypothetical protein